jgi:RNA polymerase sigma factor (TIGR02999 family)
MSDVTRILAQIESGDPAAAEQLLPLVYDELRRLAAARLAHEKPGQTLSATALVHEAYVRLVTPVGNALRGVPSTDEASGKRQPPDSAPQHWGNQRHFFAAAAEAMRRILVENARHKASLKRGGQMQRLPLEALASGGREPLEAVLEEVQHADDLLALDEALERLAQADPQAAEVVKLRYFAGLTMDEAAQALGVSPRTAYYGWEYARSWLRQALRSGESSG